jgi:hypothetical protein
VILLGVSAFQIYRRGKSCQRRSRLGLFVFWTFGGHCARRHTRVLSGDFRRSCISGKNQTTWRTWKVASHAKCIGTPRHDVFLDFSRRHVGREHLVHKRGQFAVGSKAECYQLRLAELWNASRQWGGEDCLMPFLRFKGIRPDKE